MKRQYDVALMRADSGWFERAFVDDYLLILGDATTYTKSEYIRQLTSRRIDLGNRHWSGRAIRSYGDTAIVTGRFSGKGPLKRKAVHDRRTFHVCLDKAEWSMERGF